MLRFKVVLFNNYEFYFESDPSLFMWRFWKAPKEELEYQGDRLWLGWLWFMLIIKKGL